MAFGFLTNSSNTPPEPELSAGDETKNPKIKICWFDEFSKFGDHDLLKFGEKRSASEESIPDDMKTLTYLEDFWQNIFLGLIYIPIMFDISA